MRVRHLDFFLAFAVAAEPKIGGSEQTTWIKRLDAERENLRAVMDWATESGQKSGAGLRRGGALQFLWARLRLLA